MGRGSAIARAFLGAAAALAVACGGGGGGADDLPVSFLDLARPDPGPADPGGEDPGADDAGRDPGGADAADAADPGPADPGGPGDTGADLADPGPGDPGPRDLPADPGPADPGGADPGGTDPGTDAPGCGSGPACAPGTTCINEACDPCNYHFACGADCRDCRGTATPLCLQGACVRCRVDNDCADGFWCQPDTHACLRCADDDPLRCGASCTACPADHPQCTGGACTCTADSCGALFCIDGSCQGCDTDQACGPGCAPCPAETPRCVSGTCRQCAGDGDCPGGQWCDGGGCTPCTDADPAHCGAACAACAGEAPACVAGACACEGSSCGTGRRCTGAGCVACDTDEFCGPSCGACGGTTPFCIAGACRQCRTGADCPPGWACGGDGACIDPCAGTLGCANDFAPDGKKCSTAKVLGRKVLAPSFFTVTATTSNMGNDDDLPSSIFGGDPDCWDAVYDVMYKVWLRTGDVLKVTADPTDSAFDLSLKFYRGTTCKAAWETDLIVCQHVASDGAPETYTHTATSTGWVTVVVDGESSTDGDDYGTYTLTASLACADAGCCCP